MGKLEDNGRQRETSVVLDLSDFVKEVDRFSRLVEPFAMVFYAIDDLRRWRFRYSTIALWLACNVACLLFTQGAAFVVASSLVIAVASISLLQVHTGLLNKLLPSCKKNLVKAGEGGEERGALDTVQNFRYSLIEMHDFVVKSNEYLSYFYSILKWDAPVPSAIYHTEACVFLLSLVMCPARWNCFLFINWFFLCHPHILRRGYRYLYELLSSTTQRSPQGSASTGESNLKEQISDSKGEQDKDNCEDNCDADDDSSDVDLTDDVADSSMIDLDPSPSRPGMVARLVEIKKRRKQIASAPAALKETVLVCCACHSLLVSQGQDKQMVEGSSKQGHGPG